MHVFFCRKVMFWKLFPVTFWQKKHFRTKKRAKNVDEIDTWGRFHQRYLLEFFVRMPFSIQNITRKKTFIRKTSVKLTPERLFEPNCISNTMLFFQYYQMAWSIVTIVRNIDVPILIYFPFFNNLNSLIPMLHC